MSVFYEVAELDNPAAEPFAVIRIDTEKRVEGGVEGVVVSTHWSREAASSQAEDLWNKRPSGSGDGKQH